MLNYPITDHSTFSSCEQALPTTIKRAVSRYTRFAYTCTVCLFPALLKAPYGLPVKPDGIRAHLWHLLYQPQEH